jgi:hypothetical protein
MYAHSDLFQKRMNEETAFGGRRSVRYESGRMLIILGHDKAIMKQYLLTNKHWTGPNGEKAISPKDEGLGIMTSAFQSRKFGFGMKINEEQLAEINRHHEGKEYIDKDAAKSKRGNTKKQHLPLAHLF